MDAPVLAFQHVEKTYPVDGGDDRRVLNDVTFSLGPGESVAMVGRSGSGKSTLLHLAAGIDTPTAGSIRFLGRELGALSEHDRTLLRRDHIGFVFQFFHLLPHLSLLENVMLPQWIAGGNDAAPEARAAALLKQVGLADRAADAVGTLSGGEMQRVALCRALLRRPRVLLADEPTGNLDEENGRLVLQALLDLAKEQHSSLLYVTHSRELAALAGQVWRLQSGSLTTS